MTILVFATRDDALSPELIGPWDREFVIDQLCATSFIGISAGAAMLNFVRQCRDPGIEQCWLQSCRYTDLDDLKAEALAGKLGTPWEWVIWNPITWTPHDLELLAFPELASPDAGENPI